RLCTNPNNIPDSGYASRSISLPDISHTDQRLCPNPNNIPDSGYASRSISLPDISDTD
ncbi:hypothetical protein KXX13_007442, partial [Aspergillus fumigatus]